MTVGPEIRFKVTLDEYYYLKGLATFYFDNRVIPKPSVHCLGKFAIIKAYNEWQIEQTRALQRRERRQKVIRSIIGDENNNKSGSASP
jgi:hypothetical protein